MPSMQLCIENLDQAGGCAYNYACVYTDSISWASPNEPLPMIRDPRVAFDMLFGVGGTTAERADAAARAAASSTASPSEMTSLQADARPGRSRRARSLPRPTFAKSSAAFSASKRATPAAKPRDCRTRRPACPIRSPSTCKLMFDLQVLAFAADMTRVFSFKMGRDGSSRVYPESGSDQPFHPASHHGGNEKGVKEFNLINKYHVSMLPYFLDKLKSIRKATRTCSTRR